MIAQSARVLLASLWLQKKKLKRWTLARLLLTDSIYNAKRQEIFEREMSSGGLRPTIRLLTSTRSKKRNPKTESENMNLF